MTRLIPLLLLTLTAVACADDGWLGVTIDAEGLTVPDMVDELEVVVVATETPATTVADARTCVASSQTLSGDDLELPTSVVFTAGEADWRCVAVRVIGRREGAEVLRAEELYCPDFTDTARATLTLDGRCHADTLTCPTAQVCQVTDESDAQCAPSPAGALFETAAVAVDAPCDSSR